MHPALTAATCGQSVCSQACVGTMCTGMHVYIVYRHASARSHLQHCVLLAVSVKQVCIAGVPQFGVHVVCFTALSAGMAGTCSLSVVVCSCHQQPRHHVEVVCFSTARCQHVPIHMPTDLGLHAQVAHLLVMLRTCTAHTCVSG